MKWISDLIDLIFPRHCVVCGETLSPQERDMCLNCLSSLPRIEKIHLEEIEKVFWGKIEIERATSYIYYHKSSPYNNLIHRLKYKDHPEVGERFAYMAAKDIEATGFFDGIDAIVPLPLSRKKERRRGYNQCDYIAAGISRATGIPVIKGAVTRIFSLADATLIEGKHILLIDDILTTGATLANCASTIQQGCSCRTSILTLAYTYNGI